jgi:hypothetical protein
VRLISMGQCLGGLSQNIKEKLGDTIMQIMSYFMADRALDAPMRYLGGCGSNSMGNLYDNRMSCQ